MQWPEASYHVLVMFTICGDLIGVALGYGLDDRDSFSGRRKRFFYTPQRPDPASYPVDTGVSFPGDYSGWGMKLTTHLRLVRGQEWWSYTAIPSHAFMA
jgi:hypothetical protein